MAHIPIARVNPWPTVPKDDPIRSGKPREPKPPMRVVSIREFGDAWRKYRNRVEHYRVHAKVTLFGQRTVMIHGDSDTEVREAAYALPDFYCLEMVE